MDSGTSNSSIKVSRSPVHRIKDSINFLFPTSRRSSPLPTNDIEQESKIDQLKLNAWNVREVAEHFSDLGEAEEGIIVDIQKDIVMLGCENDRMTSCYIDSVLFTMFARTQSFDGLLFVQAEGVNARVLQTHLRLFVNRLRSGKFINSYMIKQLRECLISCGWIGEDNYGNPTQEDASEFFLFLSCLYELPYLPLGMHLFHGASADANDERVITERLIQVSIPGDPMDETPVSLEEALVNYFHDSVVSGINRVDDDFKQTEVSAWQVLKLLPFYSASNEQGENIKAVESHFPTTNLILPLVLKRYGYNDNLQPFRINKNVYIPPFVNFNGFVNSDAADEPPCHCGIDVHYRLKLRSVVCHYGNKLSSGHYKGFTLDDEEGWFRLDDLDSNERVTKFNSLQGTTMLFNEFSRHGYLLFYELQRVHPGIVDEELAIEHDYHVAQNLQFVEFADKKNNCVLQ
ncbi:unnamed protein product [Rhizophagus irregularis]|nr:unnamed protein product [Rhizophagus irregularis]